MKINDYVKKYDPQNQFEVLINSWQQIEYAWNNKIDLGLINKNEIKNIVISGLGGSAISGDLLKNFLKDDLKLPLIVNRNYTLPTFVGNETLFIASSYSGNTEETISSLLQAIDIGCKIICVSTGGEIEKISREKNIAFVKSQIGFQPRYALGLSFFTLLKIFQTIGFISDQTTKVERIKKLWKEKGQAYSGEENIAIKTAESLIGFTPVIYSVADSTSAVGFRFKCQFNENSKLHAFHNEIPEMNHNEIIGWESFNEKYFNAKIINIIDESYHPQIKKRLDILSGIFKDSGADAINLNSNESDFKVRILDLIYLCDWITYYTGVLRGFDPSEINNINTLKQNLT